MTFEAAYIIVGLFTLAFVLLPMVVVGIMELQYRNKKFKNKSSLK